MCGLGPFELGSMLDRGDLATLGLGLAINDRLRRAAADDGTARRG